MSYTKIIERAWQITRKHKPLWFFGFLLALFSVGGRGNEGRGMQYTMGWEDRLPGPWVVGLIVAVIGVVAVLAIASIVLRYVSEGALIGMVREAEDAGETNVRSGWRAGWRRFLHLLAIDLMVGIPAAITVVILLGIGASPLLLLLAEVKVLTIIGVVMTILLMLLAIASIIVLGTLLSVLRGFGFRACVLEQQGPWASLQRSYHLLRQNGRQVVGIWLVMLGIGMAVNLAAIPVGLLIAALVGGPTMAVYAMTKAMAPTVLIAAALGLVGALIMAAVLSVYQVFRSTVWTLTYTEIAPRPQE